MNRRKFIKNTAMSTAALALGSCSTSKQTITNEKYIFTISYDDGFKKSFYKIAEIYEAYGLSACFNVIASGHLPDFKAVDDWILPELMGNFDDWNTLKGRGHEIMPHSWQHLNLAKQPLDKSKELITKCLDYFEKHLEGYDPAYAVFNFPFNASTPEVEAFTLKRVRAVRVFSKGVRFGQGGINPIPTDNKPVRLGCSSMGPGNTDVWVEKRVNDFLASSGGWLILNLHGVDGEGWGPMSSKYLDKLLKRLVKVKNLEILPTGQVLKRSIG